MAENKSRLPSLDRVLQTAEAVRLIEEHGRPLVLAALRERAAAIREGVTSAALGEAISAEILLDGTAQTLAQWTTATQKPVFNLTGTVLHTNLGRAPLPRAAIEALLSVAAAPSNLEYDLPTGKRGDRDTHVEQWLKRLTGAEGATVVNNNAAAVMLVLNTLARKRAVIVARGELVEIGGSFRIPEVMTAAGAQLREIGTTNRVHLKDYAAALDVRAAMIMKIHTSNYRIEGFTASVPEVALAALAQKSEVPFVVDLGSGTLLDFAQLGLPHEPTVLEAIQQGADLVTFSGDKLLGGPQAGIIVGRASLIQRIKKNPMARAVRVDKLTLAALGAVLRLYGDPARAVREIPALRLLARPPAAIEALARAWLGPMSRALGSSVTVEVCVCASQIGSGALPIEQLPSWGLSLKPRAPRAAKRAVETLAARLRNLPMPIIGRIHQGAVLLDLRCLEDTASFATQLEILAQQVVSP